ncbi:MAG: 3-dehydroquinate synthase [Dehalococcoidia bacterium]
MADGARKMIFLIGFSTTGKSKVARMVAGGLGWGFVDTDEEIVKLAGKSIPQIFAREGEEHFRELERRVLGEVAEKEGLVVATGGGIILAPRNRELMARRGMVVCLEAQPQTIYQRLLQDSKESTSPAIRPLLVGADPLARIEQLKVSRQPYYDMADRIIQTDYLTLEQVSQEVERGWREWAQKRISARGVPQEMAPACEVATATQRYPIFVGWGWLEHLGEQMGRTHPSGTAILISDETVFSLYGERAMKSLTEAGLAARSFVVPPGEATKTLDTASHIYDFLVEQRAERDDVIIALGGGMVGDLAGFVAATFLRGLPLVQVPTSLVAMVDASIGGKVAVNHPQAKNLIGAFYQPLLVLADVQALTTLDRRELASGWAEVIKHGLILDPDLFSFLEARAEKLIGLEPEATTKAIAWSASVKAGVVSEDERETGKRTILNYGHTIGHGLEAATGYGRFLHGEAVAIGMMGAALLSQRLGLIGQEVVERQRGLLQRFGLPTSCSGVGLEDVVKAVELDKKVKEKAVRWVLLGGIGKVILQHQVPQEDIMAVLRELLSV